MCDALAHRGPDDEGYHFSPDPESGSGSRFQGEGAVGLGMRRLAVIDLETGRQPIHNEDRTVWVVLNGEIYNYAELRASLEARGHSFYTRSDTEVIAHAYEEYGADAPKHLGGMFAFALWDERERRLLLARDRAGKKPLLYSIRGGKLIFASEFQAMLCHPDVSREVNREAIAPYLSHMCVPAPMTAFRGINKLMPGHTLVWQDGEARIERYWSLDFKNKIEIGEREAEERALELLRDAVRARLVADVPVGAFLSGGIDSSAVVALMSELSPRRVKTFSIGFEEQQYNELDHARRIAERFDTDHHEFVVRPRALDVLPKLVRHYGEPYADSSAIPTYYLSKLTREHVTVALNGDGGDESFAGYERYAAMQAAEYYHRLPRLVRNGVLKSALRAIPEASDMRSTFGRARRFLTVMELPRAERYLRWTAAISEEMKTELCASEFLGEAGGEKASSLDGCFAGNGEIAIADRAMMADTLNYLPNDLLVKVDIASMAVSLEARSPFLDHHLMEFAASLPASYKLRKFTTKHLLKRALAGNAAERDYRAPEDGLRRAGKPVVSRRAEGIFRRRHTIAPGARARLFQAGGCQAHLRPARRRPPRLRASTLDTDDARTVASRVYRLNVKGVKQSPLRVMRIIDRLNVGGPARHVVWLASGLGAGEFETTLITGTVPEGEGDMTYFAQEAGVEPVVIKQMSRELSPRDALVIARLLARMWKFKPDIVHTHKAKAGAAGRIAATLYRWLTPSALLLKPRRCRIVHTYHGHIFHSYYGAARTRLFILIERALARFCTDRIVVVSEQQRKEISETFRIGRPEQFQVIRLGLDFKAAPGEGRGLREQFAIPESGLLVGIVGRLCEVKNHAMFLEAAARLKQERQAEAPDVRFTLIGDGHLRAELERQAGEIGISDRVAFTGFRKDVASLYRDLDIVALTSLNEGTPLTLIEAMSHGLPVVATEVGGVVDILGRRREADEGFTVWDHGVSAPSRDSEGFARALRFLIERPDLRREMGERGRAFVYTHLSYERLLSDIRMLYQELTGIKSQAPIVVESEIATQSH